MQSARRELSASSSIATNQTYWAGALAEGTLQRRLLLDSTFLSDLDSELRRRLDGPARVFARRMRPSQVFVSVITIEEFYEKKGTAAATEVAARFSVAGLHTADAMRCGQLQMRSARRLGENDAWLAAQALRGDLALVTRDSRFDDVPGLEVARY